MTYINFEKNDEGIFSCIPKDDTYAEELRADYPGIWRWTKPEFEVIFTKPTKKFILKFISNSTCGALKITINSMAAKVFNFRISLNIIPIDLGENTLSVHITVCPIVAIHGDSRSLGICLHSISPYQNSSHGKLLHMHIPKCAGTAVDKYFTEIFGKDQSITNEMAFYSPEGVGLTEAPDQQLLCYDYISGHFPISFPLRLNLLDKTFSILRDPVDRVISQYNQCKNLPMKTDQRLICNQNTLQELLKPEKRELAVTVGLSNYMTSFFIGGFPTSLLNEHGVSLEQALNMVKPLMRAMAGIGFMDNISSFIEVLLEKEGIAYSKPFTFRENIGNYKRNEYLEVEEMIRSANELDCALYDWARNEFT